MKKLMLFASLFLVLNSLKSQNCNGISCISNPNILQEELIICYDDGYNYCPEDICNKVCELTEFTYTTTYNNGSSFVWTVIGGQLTSVSPLGNSITILWDSVGSGSISVIEQDTLMCSKSSTICINILPKPISTIITLANSDTVCFGSPIYFQGLDLNTISIDPIGLSGDSIANSFPCQLDSFQIAYELQYFWDFGDGNFSVNQNPVHVFDNPGSYNVSLTISNSCQCSDVTTTQIVVVNSPGPSIITCLGPICEGDTSKYCTDAVLPNWNIIGGTLYNSLSSDSCIGVIWDNQNNELNDGAGELLVGDLNSSCGQSQSFYSVPIVPLNPLIRGNNIVCLGTKETYSFECIAGMNYDWSISPNTYGVTIINGNNTSEILVDFQYVQNNIEITLFMSSTTLACVPLPVTIYINARPAIDEYIFPSYVCEDDTVNFSTLTNWWGSGLGNGYSFNWTVINGSTTNSSPSSQIDVIWDQGPGNGVIILEAPLGAFCETSKSFPISISEKPISAIKILGDSLICPGSTYIYSVEESNSNSSLNVNYQWTVIGGIASPANGETCTIIWDSIGPYSINITNIMQDPYCTSAVFTKIINAVPHLFPVINGSSIACLNSIETFNLTTVYPYWALINWSVSNPILGSVVSGQGNPQMEIEWGNQNGTTNVLIDVDVCGITYSQSLPLTLLNQPISFSASSNPVCSETSVIFNSTGGQGTYSWDFGDNTSSFQSNPNKSYADPGTYLVQLTYTDSVNQCVSTYSSVIDVQGIAGNLLPEGNSVYCSSGNISQPLYITTISAANPSIEWFQNGISISNSNTYTVNSNPPNHNGIGNYSVVLTDSNGCSNTLNNINIDTIDCSGGGWCGGGSCPALIPLAYTSNCNLDQGTKSFNFSSPNGNVVMWRVDNGSVSSSLNYLIDFNKAGVYNVKCLDSGCLLGSEEIIVPVVVDSDYSVICDPLNGNQKTYFFQDSSSYLLGYGAPTYNWDFGDGTNSNLQNPSHVYASNGTYNINFTVNYGTYSCNKLTTITVTDFNVSYSYSGLECENTPTMIFSSISSSTNIESWNWDFGDGASSAREMPRRTYVQSGIFTTSLLITDANGCIDTVINPITIQQNPVIDSVVSFGPFCSNDSPIDLSSVVSFNITNGEIASWSGIGINYDAITQIYSFDPLLAGSGSHEIDVIITDNNGCYDKKTIIVNVLCPQKPKVFGESEYCNNNSNYYVNLTTSNIYQGYSWYRNGVSLLNSNIYSFYDFIGVGIYDYTVAVTDSNGCTVFSEPFTLNMHDSPNIISLSTNINPCPNEEITLSHNGNQNGVDYYWNTLPQQTTSTVTVTAIPDYKYSVTAINEFGCESISLPIVVPSEIPLCGVLSGCLCDDEIMNSTGLINITGLNNSWQYSNYEWLFNGNSFNPSQNASSLIIDPSDINYLTICSGSISLAVTDNYGCLSVSNPLYIEPNCINCFNTITDFNISRTICAGQSFVFGANTYSAPGIYSSNFQSINGCDSNVVLDLTVMPLQISFQSIIICDGDSVVIGTSVYYQNGVYTDTFNVDIGCDSIQITEIVISYPIANLSSSGSLLNAFVIGGTPPYYFESGNQNGIIFTSTNNFGTPVSINPTTNGMYYFFIIDANNCISDTVFYQVDFVSSSFSDFQINNLFIYPNPSRDMFNISFNSEALQDLSIRILNVIGAEVYIETKEQFVGEYNKQISLDDYGKSIYFLEIRTSVGVVNKKLILQ